MDLTNLLFSVLIALCVLYARGMLHWVSKRIPEEFSTLANWLMTLVDPKVAQDWRIAPTAVGPSSAWGKAKTVATYTIRSHWYAFCRRWQVTTCFYIFLFAICHEITVHSSRMEVAGGVFPYLIWPPDLIAGLALLYSIPLGVALAVWQSFAWSDFNGSPWSTHAFPAFYQIAIYIWALGRFQAARSPWRGLAAFCCIGVFVTVEPYLGVFCAELHGANFVNSVDELVNKWLSSDWITFLLVGIAAFIRKLQGFNVLTLEPYDYWFLKSPSTGIERSAETGK